MPGDTLWDKAGNSIHAGAGPMRIRTLEQTTLEDLAACFNLAFSDYMVPLQAGASQLAADFPSKGIRMELSLGAFDGERLAGFILTGIDTIEGVACAYNAGTGVVPAYRGQRLTTQLYEVLLPLLKARGVEDCYLEVITANHRAGKVYESLGYTRQRTLACYKGRLDACGAAGIELRLLEQAELPQLQAFWDWHPSWQNGMPAVTRIFSNLVTVGAFVGGHLSGYLVYNPAQRRMLQFAVDKSRRRRGIGRSLFGYIAAQQSPELAVINVDEDAGTHAFLQSLGLRSYLSQYEMKLRLS